MIPLITNENCKKYDIIYFYGSFLKSDNALFQSLEVWDSVDSSPGGVYGTGNKTTTATLCEKGAIKKGESGTTRDLKDDIYIDCVPVTDPNKKYKDILVKNQDDSQLQRRFR